MDRRSFLSALAALLPAAWLSRGEPVKALGADTCVDPTCPIAPHGGTRPCAAATRTVYAEKLAPLRAFKETTFGRTYPLCLGCDHEVTGPDDGHAPGCRYAGKYWRELVPDAAGAGVNDDGTAWVRLGPAPEPRLFAQSHPPAPRECWGKDCQSYGKPHLTPWECSIRFKAEPQLSVPMSVWRHLYGDDEDA